MNLKTQKIKIKIQNQIGISKISNINSLDILIKKNPTKNLFYPKNFIILQFI